MCDEWFFQSFDQAGPDLASVCRSLLLLGLPGWNGGGCHGICGAVSWKRLKVFKGVSLDHKDVEGVVKKNEKGSEKVQIAPIQKLSGEGQNGKALFEEKLMKKILPPQTLSQL